MNIVRVLLTVPYRGIFFYWRFLGLNTLYSEVVRYGSTFLLFWEMLGRYVAQYVLIWFLVACPTLPLTILPRENNMRAHLRIVEPLKKPESFFLFHLNRCTCTLLVFRTILRRQKLKFFDFCFFWEGFASANSSKLSEGDVTDHFNSLEK